MSIIFSDNFNSGNLSNYDLVPTGANTKAIGCSGTRCLTCGNNLSLGVRKGFTPVMTDGSWRFDYAYFAESGASLGQYILSILTLTDSYRLARFYINPNGSISIFSQALGSIITSSTGRIPTNGTWVALQITAHFYTTVGSFGLNTTADFQVISNNSVVWNPTNVVLAANNYGPSPIPADWDGFELLTYGTSTTSSDYSLSAIDNIEVEDAVVTPTFNVCTAIPVALFKGSCSFIPPPVVGNGMYKIVNGSLKSNDTLYTSLITYSTSITAIPQPLIVTGFIGDEK